MRLWELELADASNFMSQNRVDVKFTSVLADGNCLYRALSSCLYKTERKHAQIRSLIVCHLQKYQDYYSKNLPFFDINDYTSSQILGDHGSEPSLYAAAIIFDVNIYVWTQSSPKVYCSRTVPRIYKYSNQHAQYR